MLFIILIKAMPRPAVNTDAITPSSTTLAASQRSGVTSWLHTTRCVRCSYSRDSRGAAQNTAMTTPSGMGTSANAWLTLR